MMPKDKNAPSALNASETSAWSLVCLILLFTVIEALLLLGDLGVLGALRLRQLVYDYGAFWPGLLSGWKPNYAAQPGAMFVTYGLLHGGVTHLLVNMITLWSLGRIVIERVGTRGFLIVYLGAQFGGAVVFAMLAQPFPPMVGASGALFGLAGGLLAWNYVDRFTYRERLWPVANSAFWLVVLNLVLWWAMDGQLAWETHLGGFIAGWVMALLVDPRPQDAGPQDAPEDPQ